jgi:hypothetical protein
VPSGLTLQRLKPVGFSVRRQPPRHARSYTVALSVSALGVPRREQAQPIVPDVDGRVEVAIMDHAAGADPVPVGQRERLNQRPAPMTPPGRGEEAIDHGERLAVPHGLVLQLPAELAARGVCEALGQLGSTALTDVRASPASRGLPDSPGHLGKMAQIEPVFPMELSQVEEFMDGARRRAELIWLTSNPARRVNERRLQPAAWRRADPT